MIQLLIIGSVFLCVATLVFGLSLTMRATPEDELAARLVDLTKNGGRGQRKKEESEVISLLKTPLDAVPNALETLVGRFLNVRRYLDQAGVSMSTNTYVLVVAGLALGAGLLVAALSPYVVFAPMAGAAAGFLPIAWLWMKRKKRMKRFGAQLPEALELMSRALRAGHSLPAGIQLVAQQMNDPLGPEFGRCYEQQNLGIPLERAIRDMTERVANVDLRFFATAVILQRQTGGDLAEILDKIGRLIRERFTIWGQIQALTGEGRLSGIVLLALPPVLFLVMLRLNYDYVMLLFNDPLGIKMLIGGIIFQVLGAVVIKKIITIKV